jgi:hypothetical protein
MRPIVVMLLAGIASAALAGDAVPAGAVHPDPAVVDPRFKPHQLPFDLPSDGVARAEFRSERFYAVLLASPPACSVSEARRLEVQAQFPARKVFATRFDCDDDEELITYTNVKPGVGFIAVYAGRTLAEARGVLAGVLAGGRYPGANLRRMQVVLVTP